MAEPDTNRRARRWSATGPEPPLSPGEGRAHADAEPGLGDLIRSLTADLATLVRQEIELARLEVVGTAKGMARDGAWVAAGAAIAAVGGLCLVLAAALGLGALLGSYWLGTLLTGLALVLVAGGVVWKGLKGMRSRELAPKRTAESLREDARWAGREAQELKEAIKEQP